MTTKRTAIRRALKANITPLALQTYVRARDLLDNHDIERWEERGGRRREYLDAADALDVMLGRKPWQTSIMDCVGEEAAPDYVTPTNDWQGARDFLTALEEAASR
ncbi:hypothetical protein ACMA5K_05715 [Bradyrhizobium diazoefficiens]|uniref:hypothetical protein n=1 Tax=Bradyrhizobium diazoefficiens TaxID=1355477 RepID=UPI0015B4CC1E|nr:hypothetical protein [Bradyrhizobium diazoefficiens]QLD40512.1 hypothetical protein HUW42_05655 [Bradyrhizobium diazoefficiens]